MYETQDGWLCVVLVNQTHWDEFFAVLGLHELLTDARFASTEARHANDAELARIVCKRMSAANAATWFAKLDAAGVPVEVVDAEFALRLHDDPEFRKRQ